MANPTWSKTKKDVRVRGNAGGLPARVAGWVARLGRKTQPKDVGDDVRRWMITRPSG